MTSRDVKTIVSDAFEDTPMGLVLGLFSELSDNVFERLCTSDSDYVRNMTMLFLIEYLLN